jgi:hypothetical protein
MLGWGHYGLQKLPVGTPYTEHVFLHPVGSACHIEHSHAPGAGNFDALYFLLGWDRYGLHRKHVRKCYVKHVFFASNAICGSHSAFWCSRGAKH